MQIHIVFKCLRTDFLSEISTPWYKCISKKVTSYTKSWTNNTLVSSRQLAMNLKNYEWTLIRVFSLSEVVDFGKFYYIAFIKIS